MNPNPQTIGIVFPAYNPRKDWELRLLAEIKQFQQFIQEEIYIIVVDDGSLHRPSETVFTFLQDNLPHFQYKSLVTNQGKGAALREGFRNLDCDLYIYTDLDMPFTFESVERVYNALKNGADVVCGDRGASYIGRLPVKRKIISRISRGLNRFVLGMKNSDTQGGLKGFTNKGKAIFLETQVNRFLFDTEFIYKVEKRKDIVLATVLIDIQQEVAFSDFGLKTVFVEMFNFFSIFATKARRH